MNGQKEKEIAMAVDHYSKLARDELIRAIKQYGIGPTFHEGYAVLLEEVDELWDEIKKVAY